MFCSSFSFLFFILFLSLRTTSLLESQHNFLFFFFILFAKFLMLLLLNYCCSSNMFLFNSIIFFNFQLFFSLQFFKSLSFNCLFFFFGHKVLPNFLEVFYLTSLRFSLSLLRRLSSFLCIF